MNLYGSHRVKFEYTSHDHGEGWTNGQHILGELQPITCYWKVLFKQLIWYIISGKNCYAGNKVIPAGKDVHINEHTICRCPDQFGFGMTAHRAVCKDITTTTIP